MWKLNNTFLNNQWFKDEIKREIKNYVETNENENTHIISYGMLQKRF